VSHPRLLRQQAMMVPACASDVRLLSTSYGSKETSAASMLHRQLCFYGAQGTPPTATLVHVQGSRHLSASHVSAWLHPIIQLGISLYL
jgi:hypothetical protein